MGNYLPYIEVKYNNNNHPGYNSFLITIYCVYGNENDCLLTNLKTMQ